MAPRVVWGDSEWRRVRERCYAAAEYHCQACGIPKHMARPKAQLDCHERYNFHYEEGIVTLRELVALCGLCHNYIHYERLEGMTKAGIYSAAFQQAVIAHGEAILTAAGLPLRPEIPPVETWAPWSQWRLILDDGKPHFSRFINEQHLTAHYATENARQLAGSRRL